MARTTSRLSNALKTNLILAILLVIGASAALWYEYKRKPVTEKEATEQTKLAASLLKAPLESVVIENKTSGGAIKFQCDGKCLAEGSLGRWHLVDPLQARADEGTFSGALSALFSVVPTEKIEVTGMEDPVLKEFALDAERRKNTSLTVKVTGQAEPYVFYFGEHSSVGDLVYTVLTGPQLKVNNVNLLGPQAVELVQKKVNYWRYKKLLEFTGAEIAALEYKGSTPEGSFRVVRSAAPGAASETWFLEPGHIPADATAVDTELSGLASIQASDFVSENKSADAKMLDLAAKPQAEVRLVFQPTKDVKTQRPPLDVFGWEDKRKPTSQYMTLSTTSYIAKIDTTILQKLQRKLSDFRLRQLYRASEKAAFRKAQIQFTAANKRYEFKTDNGQTWKPTDAGAPELQGFDSAAFDQHISSLGGVSIRAFVGKKPPVSGLEKTMVYDFFDGDGKSLRSFAIFKAKGTASQAKAKPGLPAGPSTRWFALLGASPGSSPGLSGAAGEYIEIDSAYSSALDIQVDRWMKKPAASPSPAAAPKSGATPHGLPAGFGKEPSSLPIVPSTK